MSDAEDDYNKESVDLIAGIVDTDKNGLISFSEFKAFEELLCLPDALYKTAFQLFDRDGKGFVTFEGFEEVMKKTTLYKSFSFNMDSAFIRLYFSNKTRMLTYQEFNQFLHDIHAEHWVEAFKKCDKNETGFISIEDFKKITISVKKHLLTKVLETNVINTPDFLSEEQKISFAYYMAFSSLLNNMELIKRVYLNVTNGSRKQEVTKDQLMHYGQMKSQITPLEIDILFALCNKLRNTNGSILYSDLKLITPERYYKKTTQCLAKFQAVSSPEERSVFIIILENLYRFTLGGLAGAAGAAMVYPIDLVKTRVQNQRKTATTKEVILYESLWDCCKKVFRTEGVFGLYKGLLVQVVGVAPEKAVMLSVKDFVRDKLADKSGNVSVLGDTIAGCCAGASQVIFTNPLEIVKIRLQVAGEVSQGKKVSAWSIIKDLGFRGLYKGSLACIIRDVAFSAVYFPAYTLTKKWLANDSGYNHPGTLFVAGTISGVPGAFLATPVDVIKTRQQVKPRAGQTIYKGMMDTARKILVEEGSKAFFKGGLARVFRTCPQFGITLITYEVLQRLFFVDFAGRRPAGSEQQVATAVEDSMAKPQHIGGYHVALPILTGLETKFGISLPRWSTEKPQE